MDDRTYERQGEGAWMWMVLAMAVLGVLGWMLLPAVSRHPDSRRKHNCGNNARQILLSMLVYGNDNDQKWPAFIPASLAGTPLDAYSARIIASRSMERLVIETGGDLSNRIFACVANPAVKPMIDPSPARDDGAWGASATSAVAYAYDWAAPSNAQSSRVVIADRDPRNHRGMVPGCFADGHVAIFPARRVMSVGRQTIGSDGMPVDYEAANREAAGEDIYAPIGDDGDPLAIGGGSVTRAWVK